MIEEFHKVNDTSCHILLSESYRILLQNPVVTFLRERHWLVAQIVKKIHHFMKQQELLLCYPVLYQPKSNTAYTDEWKAKSKASRYRPGVAQRVPGSWGSQISWQRHRMVVMLSALRTCRIYPKEIIVVLISVRVWVEPRVIVRSEGLMSMKNSNGTIWDRNSDLLNCSAVS
jgi:hypothetical protein